MVLAVAIFGGCGIGVSMSLLALMLGGPENIGPFWLGRTRGPTIAGVAAAILGGLMGLIVTNYVWKWAMIRSRFLTEQQIDEINRKDWS